MSLHNKSENLITFTFHVYTRFFQRTQIQTFGHNILNNYFGEEKHDQSIQNGFERNCFFFLFFPFAFIWLLSTRMNTN